MECDNHWPSADRTIGLGFNFLALVEVALLSLDVSDIRACMYEHSGRGFWCELKS